MRDENISAAAGAARVNVEGALVWRSLTYQLPMDDLAVSQSVSQSVTHAYERPTLAGMRALPWGVLPAQVSTSWFICTGLKVFLG